MKAIYTITLTVMAALLQAQPMSNTNELKSLHGDEETVRLIPAPARFYFLPNLDAYFDARENLYIYQVNGQWVKAREIPSGYRGYSIYNGTRVELADYNGNQPYTLLKDHQKQYPKRYSSRRMAPKKSNPLALN
ncbi:MAG TPA: hypothetical protein PLA69_08300 [Flavobacterium sp.]|nr:hypothetical protein [Flavobacterium sp.]